MTLDTTANPPGSTQTATGTVIVDGRPVFDVRYGHAMPAGHNPQDGPQHSAARRGQAGHQRRA